MVKTQEFLQAVTEQIQSIRDEIGKVIVGHEDVVEGVVIALISGGHVLLEGVDLPRTGVPTRSGILLTKTLLFQAEGTGAAGASPIFRAIDKQTGEIIAEIDLPFNQTGLPFTYEHDGKQYLAMFIGGGGAAAELAVYSLP